MNRTSVFRAMTSRATFPRILRGSLASATVLASLLFISTEASAQASEGQELERGVAAGPLVISPRLRLGVGYDTNVALGAKSELRASSPELIISPSVGLAMRESGMVRFNANAGVSWRQYLTGEDTAKDSSGLDANAGVALQVNHAGPVSLALTDSLRQTNDAIYHPDLNDDPYQISFSEYGLDMGSGRVLTNNAKLGLKFHPGGDNDDAMGFVGGLAVTHVYNHYQQRPSQDRQRVGGNVNLGWRFLPRSVVFAEVSASRTLYNEQYDAPITRDIETDLSPAVNAALRNNNSTPVMAGLGLRTLLLPRLGVTTRIGYSTAFYDEGSSPKRVAFQLQADSQLTTRMNLRAGYATNFADSTFANYLVYHRFHASYSLNMQPIRFTLSGFAQINKYADTETSLVASDGTVLENYTTGSRRDVPLGLSAEFSVNAGSHVVLGANYSILGNMSNFDAEPDRGWLNMDKLSGSPEFLRHRIYLFVALAL